ncbi:hypothetical protein Y1Q_0019533 [Alligator mississippiensis]|uniref:Gypsy retrotransposon integrase-like protein 1 n=1 Tax=Alligator mississippiensis TaxID=8496 RepID=A0A151NMR2_ALLMI|nr:hypothetical protein Y1Q_0019533 [Alligator mississippiensis]
MKTLARNDVQWPGMDNDIERVMRECSICQATHHNPPKAPVFPWEITKEPWSCIHIDFAGPFQGSSPSELLMGCHLKTCLDLVNPDLVRDMQFRKEKELDSALESGPLCLFIPQETVFAQNYGTAPQWTKSKIDVLGAAR